jgi:hypothetical protein
MILAAVLRVPVPDLLLPKGDELLVLGKVPVAHEFHRQMVLPRDAADLAGRLHRARQALEDTPVDEANRAWRDALDEAARPEDE